MLSKEDQRLNELFAPLAEPVADDGFSRAVLRRIDRARRLRTGVFVLAGSLGGLAALWELRALRDLLAAAAIRIPADWLPLDWLTANPLVVGTALLAALLFLGLGALEDR